MSAASTLPPPVDRARRFLFVAGVTTFCLIMAAAFTLFVTLGGGIPLYHIPLVETFISSCMSLATMMGMAYVTGSVIDYSTSTVFKGKPYVLSNPVGGK